MKKYSMFFGALLIAIAFSAYNTISGKTNAGSEQLLYWYYIQPNGNIGSAVDGTNLRHKSDVLDDVGCPDETGPDCARGYTSTQVLNTPAPAVDGDDEHIMKEEF